MRLLLQVSLSLLLVSAFDAVTSASERELNSYRLNSGCELQSSIDGPDIALNEILQLKFRIPNFVEVPADPNLESGNFVDHVEFEEHNLPINSFVGALKPGESLSEVGTTESVVDLVSVPRDLDNIQVRFVHENGEAYTFYPEREGSSSASFAIYDFAELQNFEAGRIDIKIIGSNSIDSGHGLFCIASGSVYATGDYDEFFDYYELFVDTNVILDQDPSLILGQFMGTVIGNPIEGAILVDNSSESQLASSNAAGGCQVGQASQQPMAIMIALIFGLIALGFSIKRQYRK